MQGHAPPLQERGFTRFARVGFRDRSRPLFLGIAAGLSIALAGAPSELCALAFLGPALLLLAIERPSGAPVPRLGLAVLAGTACGIACNGWTMSWIIELLEVFGGFPAIASWPIGALLWWGQSLPFAAACWIALASMHRGIAGWLALPASLVIAGSYAPMIFPWRLAASQIGGVVFVQLAEIGGPPLVDLAIALASCAALEALRRPRALPALVAAIAIGLPLAYGWVRLDQIRALRASSPALQVGVVQPNLGVAEKHDPMLREPHLRLHRAMTRELEREGAELVLWPESSFPFWLDRADREDALSAHRRILAGGVRGPIVFGSLTYEGERRFNSIVAIDASGRFTGTYDKVHLLAFGEYVPLWDYLPPLQWYLHRGFVHGSEAGLLSIAGTTIGPLNCYEDLVVEHARRTAALDPGFLANFTNDAWFGDTAAPHLHHMLARLRAVETRRDLVRAVNTGISALVLATGEDEHRTAPFERTSFVAEVRLLDGLVTPWVRYGDLVTPALLGLLLGAAFARRIRPASGASSRS